MTDYDEDQPYAPPADVQAVLDKRFPSLGDYGPSKWSRELAQHVLGQLVGYIEFGDAIETFFPYDGPHSGEKVVDATRGAAGLVRYANNATGSWNGRNSLEYAHTIDRVLGTVAASTYGLVQLLEQLGTAAERHAEDPGLFDDRRDPAISGRDTATALAGKLSEALADVGRLNKQIDEARQLSSHLGND